MSPLGGVPSGHDDRFAQKGLPPRELWPKFDYSIPALATLFSGRLNIASRLLDDSVQRGWGHRSALHLGEKSWSYGHLLEQANRIARVLVEDYGLVSGNRVLLRGRNTPMLVACWFAVAKAGGICVTTMPLLRARELRYMVERVEIRHALCDIASIEDMEAARVECPELKHVGYFSAFGDGSALDARLDFAAATKPVSFKSADTAADDIAIIAFTSGTTGNPKATLHFHRDLLAICSCYPRYIAPIEPEDVITGTPPVAFTFGLGALILFPFYFGASARFLEGAGPDVMLHTIEKHRVTQVYSAPRAYALLTEKMSRFDLSSLRCCNSAGETLPSAIWDEFFERSGIRIIDGIGSTEMLQTFVSAPARDARPGYTGKPVPGYDARVVDPAGKELPANAIGHLATRGPTGCRYFDDVERQKEYVRCGWNFTGDLFEKTEDGYFRYVARADDLIISAGYNIGAPEVEAVLLEHPKVSDCAVVAAPDAERSFVVKAYVVLNELAIPDDGTVKELQEFVKAQIAPYKYPRRIEFVRDLPRTQTGKLQRYKLRQAEIEKAAQAASRDH